MKKIVILMISLLIFACTDHKKATRRLPADDGNIVIGTLLAPDGTTPIAAATVYIPAESQPGSSQTKAGCIIPQEKYIDFDCSAADGSFQLNAATVVNDVFTVKAVKGSFVGKFIVNRNANSRDIGNLVMPNSIAEGAARMAVVTGEYDRMEDILAKLGYGVLNANNALEIGTENFDLYSGYVDSLPAQYPDVSALFVDGDLDGKPDINDYDIVFLNCGIDVIRNGGGGGYEEFTLQINGGLDTNGTAVVQILRDYVQNGGKLYVTDLSYDFVEQTFPEFIDFFGPNPDVETDRESPDAAQVGEPSIISAATPNDALLSEWLDSISCGMDSCLKPDATIDIEGFLGGWAVMEGAHVANAANLKTWITGPVSWAVPTEIQSGVKPLTVSFAFGSGTVLYTSYHTLEETPSPDFRPQERVLQYLIFEL